MKQKPKAQRHLAIVRVFDLTLSFDSELSDDKLEAESRQLIEMINEVLKQHFVRELPQLALDVQKTKKKLKIGITPVMTDETLEEDE